MKGKGNKKERISWAQKSKTVIGKKYSVICIQYQ